MQSQEECSSSDPKWTKEENEQFELLLITYQDECSNGRYESIASYLPNKSADQVRKHFEDLCADVQAIEDGLVPMPNYTDDAEIGVRTTWTMVYNNNNNNNQNNKNKEPERPSKKKKRGINWTVEEQRLFLLGMHEKGKGDWRGISREYVQTKSPSQVASHAQKYELRQRSQVAKKRKSIHDIKFDPSQMPAYHLFNNNTKPNSDDLPPADAQVQGQQHGTDDHAQADQGQLQINIQNTTDNEDCMKLQQQKQLHLQDDAADHEHPQEQQQRQHQHQQQSDWLGIDDDDDHEQWEKKLQEIDKFVQPQAERQLITHDDDQTREEEVNDQRQSAAQEVAHLGMTEVNQGQDAHLILQNTSNVDDQLQGTQLGVNQAGQGTSLSVSVDELLSEYLNAEDFNVWTGG